MGVGRVLLGMGLPMTQAELRSVGSMLSRMCTLGIGGMVPSAATSSMASAGDGDTQVTGVLYRVVRICPTRRHYTRIP